MWKTLLLRLSNYCGNKCVNCSLNFGDDVVNNSGDLKLIMKCLESLSNVRFNEAVLLCPTTTNQASEVVDVLKSTADKVYFFVPEVKIANLSKDLISKFDEVPIVVNDLSNLTNLEKRVNAMVSFGVENLAIYASLSPAGINEALLKRLINLSRKYELKVRVGEPPYSCDQNLTPFKNTLLEKGYDVGLPYGFLYGYKASVAYVEGHKITFLNHPKASECFKIYVDHSGKVGKCPYDNLTKNLIPSSNNELKEILRKPCPLTIASGMKVKPLVSLNLKVNDVVIPEETIQLLDLVDRLGSLRKACKELKISPSTCVERIRKLEKRIKTKLIHSTRGGVSRGKTTLTSEGLKLIELYKDFKERQLGSRDQLIE